MFFPPHRMTVRVQPVAQLGCQGAVSTNPYNNCLYSNTMYSNVLPSPQDDGSSPASSTAGVPGSSVNNWLYNTVMFPSHRTTVRVQPVAQPGYQGAVSINPYSSWLYSNTMYSNVPFPQDDGSSPASSTAGVPGSSVNKSIQQLALKYCNECKSSFDELSKHIQVIFS